jgi:hypothetical protein
LIFKRIEKNYVQALGTPDSRHRNVIGALCCRNSL